MAANGIDVGFGSGQRLQDDTQMLAEDDAANLYANQEQKAKGYTIDASNFVAQAKGLRAQAKSAKIQSYFGAATSLLGGLTQAAQLSKPPI